VESSGHDDAAVYEAPAVLRLLWADPQYMPEHLALWSLKHFGPRAASAVEKLRDAHPGAGPGELEARVIERHTRVSMFEGAFVGGPFVVLIPSRSARRCWRRRRWRSSWRRSPSSRPTTR
jgi:hypothetical protein